MRGLSVPWLHPLSTSKKKPHAGFRARSMSASLWHEAVSRQCRNVHWLHNATFASYQNWENRRGRPGPLRHSRHCALSSRHSSDCPSLFHAVAQRADHDGFLSHAGQHAASYHFTARPATQAQSFAAKMDVDLEKIVAQRTGDFPANGDNSQSSFHQESRHCHPTEQIGASVGCRKALFPSPGRPRQPAAAKNGCVTEFPGRQADDRPLGRTAQLAPTIGSSLAWDASRPETPRAASACSSTVLARHRRSMASALIRMARSVIIINDSVVQSFLKDIFSHRNWAFSGLFSTTCQ